VSDFGIDIEIIWSHRHCVIILIIIIFLKHFLHLYLIVIRYIRSIILNNLMLWWYLGKSANSGWVLRRDIRIIFMGFDSSREILEALVLLHIQRYHGRLETFSETGIGFPTTRGFELLVWDFELASMWVGWRCLILRVIVGDGDFKWGDRVYLLVIVRCVFVKWLFFTYDMRFIFMSSWDK
jgi:hypothetical protein